MIVAFDNTFLSLVLRPGSPPASNYETGQPVEYSRERIEALVDSLANTGGRVLIPTPCLTELLSAVPDLERAVSEIDRSPAFQIASFDARCAIELAEEIGLKVLHTWDLELPSDYAQASLDLGKQE